MDQQRYELHDHNARIDGEESNTEEIRTVHFEFLSLVEHGHHNNQPQDVEHCEHNHDGVPKLDKFKS